MIAPTPWRRPDLCADICDAKGRVLACVEYAEGTSVDDIEIADRIVTAVNSHDALVEALRLVSVELYWLNLPEGASAKVFEALALARGESP